MTGEIATEVGTVAEAAWPALLLLVFSTPSKMALKIG